MLQVFELYFFFFIYFLLKELAITLRYLSNCKVGPIFRSKGAFDMKSGNGKKRTQQTIVRVIFKGVLVIRCLV